MAHCDVFFDRKIQVQSKSTAMKTNLNNQVRWSIIIILASFPVFCNAQNDKAFIDKYMKKLPGSQAVVKDLQKYNMTAVYINRDLYGNFTSKTRVTGDYTMGFSRDTACWNNVYISNSQKYDEAFQQGTKVEYIENFRYVPSDEMLKPEAFKNFAPTPDNIFARNLIWDMYTLEIFAWNYLDSLVLNEEYILPDIKGEFDMSEIGIYHHEKIFMKWKGVTEFGGELCAILDFTADDNRVEMSMAQIKTKGTEQYWGSILISLRTKSIEYAEMYGGTIQEIEVSGMKDKFLVKTIRELEVTKIR